MLALMATAACDGNGSNPGSNDASTSSGANAGTGGHTAANTGGNPTANGGAAPANGGATSAHTGGANNGGTGGRTVTDTGGALAANGGATSSMGGAPAASGGATSTGGATSGSGGANTDGSSPRTYSTDFPLTESPISENGAWKHLGADWTLVDTSNGLAWGTQTGTGAYNDSYAYLSGFPPDQMGSAVIHLASPDPAATHEVEILLRWSDDTHVARGYECNLAWNGAYAEIVRWNGALSDFTYLNRSSAPSGVHQGDTFSAKIVGNTITSYLNGVQIATATDSTYSDGNPGMGFWRGSGAAVTLRDYGFESYSAHSVP
jgi:hypothetical protein